MLSDTGVFSSLEELCITQGTAVNSFARGLKPTKGNVYIYIYIYICMYVKNYYKQAVLFLKQDVLVLIGSGLFIVIFGISNMAPIICSQVLLKNK